ncbi:hypothetical protein PHYBLDRAFT_164693 [Phycomyces blakesleeanus NRRL 1555(-)]|uniref:Uncharacterized protein n=1 Tax=Phycomyces blakesleeanus (strain ATCC 8743b / DSM 1359 / FGSC 10004 / NBRC 33097 / NRRL 1555) TaxID=763407 RepID=A0A162Y145_PHYB8|nr:hypothetical protein PHYBLDRAFT_164693 [Phycomyces blakesleeanus NRRL 1555(-)]OAD77805.1 hypothetical protein PHYBLDRAFT_164693 [Phycomyces blakesleeanus NRRL 1555(-)]|eukprot:XP_018295845.1 hypothetical protein PHYBLDRAFT_164693 [Phycomyces blakesleeanus NRRL 1555(-)]
MQEPIEAFFYGKVYDKQYHIRRSWGGGDNNNCVTKNKQWRHFQRLDNGQECSNFLPMTRSPYHLPQKNMRDNTSQKDVKTNITFSVVGELSATFPFLVINAMNDNVSEAKTEYAVVDFLASLLFSDYSK